VQLLQFQIYLHKGAKELGSLSFLLSSKDQDMVKPLFISEVGGNRVFENVTKILSYLPNCADTRHDHNLQVQCNCNFPIVACLLL